MIPRSTNSEMARTQQSHTDNVGTEADNQRLSENRAAAVRTYLVNHGIDVNRVTSKGYGESSPVDNNENDAGRAMNRRVEFTITAN